jgi:hypothetical protein
MFRQQTHQMTKSCRGHQTWSFQLFQTPKLRKIIIIESLKKLKRSCKIDSNMMRQRWKSKSSELWTNDIGHKILIFFWRHLNVEEEEEEVWEHVHPHTPNLGLYQFLFRSKPMLEAYLNFQKNCWSWIFQNLQKIRVFHERTDGFLASYLICYNFFENHDYLSKLGLSFFWEPWLWIILRIALIIVGVGGSVSCFWVTAWHWSKVQTQLGFEKLIITREQFK